MLLISIIIHVLIVFNLLSRFLNETLSYAFIANLLYPMEIIFQLLEKNECKLEQGDSKAIKKDF